MTSLYVDRKGVELESDGEALVFRENGERVGTVPLAPITRVFLRGDVRIQTSLLAKLGEHGIGVVILSGRKAEPTLLMARPHNDARRRIKQYQASLDTEFCLKKSQELVRAKITGQQTWFNECREHDFGHRYELSLALRKLTPMLEQIEQKDNIASLRGLEGAAAAVYFEGLAVIAPPRLKFSHRNRRPPKDPLNAIISLGYTLLHSEAVQALYGAGLDPFIGFFHSLEFGRESLASDMIEPFRVEIDRYALELFRKDTLRVEDFSTTEAGCLLGKNGRSKFYGAWENRVESLRKKLTESIDSMADQLGSLEF